MFVEQAQKRLLNSMDALTSNWAFSVGGEASELPPVPGLAIGGYGPVAFPINDMVADALKPYGRNRPLGKVKQQWLMNRFVRHGNLMHLK